MNSNRLVDTATLKEKGFKVLKEDNQFGFTQLYKTAPFVDGYTLAVMIHLVDEGENICGISLITNQEELEEFIESPVVITDQVLTADVNLPAVDMLNSLEKLITDIFTKHIKNAVEVIKG